MHQLPHGGRHLVLALTERNVDLQPNRVAAYAKGLERLLTSVTFLPDPLNPQASRKLSALPDIRITPYSLLDFDGRRKETGQALSFRGLASKYLVLTAEHSLDENDLDLIQHKLLASGFPVELSYDAMSREKDEDEQAILKVDSWRSIMRRAVECAMLVGRNLPIKTLEGIASAIEQGAERMLHRMGLGHEENSLQTRFNSTNIAGNPVPEAKSLAIEWLSALRAYLPVEKTAFRATLDARVREFYEQHPAEFHALLSVERVATIPVIRRAAQSKHWKVIAQAVSRPTTLEDAFDTARRFFRASGAVLGRVTQLGNGSRRANKATAACGRMRGISLRALWG